MQGYTLAPPQPLVPPLAQLRPPPHFGSPQHFAQSQYFSELQHFGDPSGIFGPPQSPPITYNPQSPFVLTPIQVSPRSPLQVFNEPPQDVAFVNGTWQVIDPFALAPVNAQEDIALGWFGEVGASIGLSPGWFAAVLGVAAVLVFGASRRPFLSPS